jgi:hypothetical protein
MMDKEKGDRGEQQERMKAEVAMRVYAARFNTDGKVMVKEAAFIAWEAAEEFVMEMERRV